jgi:hypothetical protein
MADQRAYLNTLMRSMIQRHFRGNQSCAAREIAEYWSGREMDEREVDIGGFSRKCNGTREFSLNDAFALMSITGSRRLLKAIGEMLECEAQPSLPRTELAARAAKEAGEAVAAAIGDGDPACIAKEAGEAENEFRKIRVQAEAEMRGEAPAADVLHVRRSQGGCA